MNSLAGDEFFGELGSIVYADRTVFRLWAPRAKTVLLNLYTKGDGDDFGDRRGIAMERVSGLWLLEIAANLSGTYYTFTVNGRETADPYAHTAGINGRRGMVLDFNSSRVTPEGWEREHIEYAQNSAVLSPTDAVIWEVHIRDFSNQSVQSKYPGKYLAFTEKLVNASNNPICVDYLRELGVTHVHLLPIAEYATVDQTRLNDPSYNAFNWGYDPYSHNIPSGVYSTDPYDGHCRVREVREMVKALHRAKIGVIMDVVYNHTYDLNVPLAVVGESYYYRYNDAGEHSNGSGCGNELASERPMCRKYIVDSLKFWAENYHIDGFRFDLMGVHDLETMAEIARELRKINPNILLYGEGWTGGQCALNYNLLAVKHNITSEKSPVRGIAVFSDTVRDGVKGEVFQDTAAGYVNGKAWENVNRIKFAVMGGVSNNFRLGWSTLGAAECINYVSAHDNNTLWDKLQMTSADKGREERLKMNRLAAGIYLTCQGIPFMQAGEEMLRSKPFMEKNSGVITQKFDHNSYKSPDEVNNIRWSRLRVGTDSLNMMEYYKGLINFRKAHPALRLTSSSEIENAVSFIDYPGKYGIVSFTVAARGEELLIIYNPLGKEVIPLPSGRWAKCVDEKSAGTAILEVCSKSVTVEAVSINAFVRID